MVVINFGLKCIKTFFKLFTKKNIIIINVNKDNNAPNIVINLGNHEQKMKVFNHIYLNLKINLRVLIKFYNIIDNMDVNLLKKYR